MPAPHRLRCQSLLRKRPVSFLVNYFPASLFLRSESMYSLRQTERLGIVIQSLKGIAAAVGRKDYRITLISYDDVATVASVSHHIAGLEISRYFLSSNEHRLEDHWFPRNV